MTDYASLKAEIAKPAYAGMSDAQIAGALAAQTATAAVDTTFAAAMGVLYARRSWRRVQQVASGDIAPSAIAAPPGSTPSEIVAVCQMLVSGASPPGSPIATSNPAVSSAIQADLALLAGAKLADGKGIIWAPDELASGDPGDAATLMGTLAQAAAPVWPGLTVGDIQTARAQP